MRCVPSSLSKPQKCGCAAVEVGAFVSGAVPRTDGADTAAPTLETTEAFAKALGRTREGVVRVRKAIDGRLPRVVVVLRVTSSVVVA